MNGKSFVASASLVLASFGGSAAMAQTPASPAAQTQAAQQAAPSPLATSPLTAAANIRIKNFGRVSSDYYRGAQPVGADYHDLASLGVKTVIDLERTGDSAEEQEVQSAGMKFFRINLSDKTWPDKKDVDQFLQIVADSNNLPVYVHCHAGRHRTGEMTAVYRITHDGWTADRAFGEMKQYQFEHGVGHMPLKAFVYDFYSHKPGLNLAPAPPALTMPAASGPSAPVTPATPTGSAAPAPPPGAGSSALNQMR